VDRRCALIDILGFRGLIDGLKANGNRFVALREVLKKSFMRQPVSRRWIGAQVYPMLSRFRRSPLTRD
jgi:hypothetical protein